MWDPLNPIVDLSIGPIRVGLETRRTMTHAQQAVCGYPVTFLCTKGTQKEHDNSTASFDKF